MNLSEDVDLLAVRTTELIKQIDEASFTLLSRFCQIIEVVDNDAKDQCTVASESYQIETHAASMIRSAEELLLISRLIKEAWMLWETNAWDPIPEQMKNISPLSLDQILALLNQYKYNQSSENTETEQQTQETT
ncbi:hypothetical protein PNEG_00208 [Pneumocystis murina B123]|uniref:Mediator of RNA polymerase II transcription subunit 22 n=1 Tax=Pneumocystis murina (strain B123) TaxID=1069680 RepID=M7NX99_PNEMU|nr:hypothetical protein PNEG_00208 [Pneumocystis murina B123]EMR11781.1 hypothetical protein PNEG_00208 [Pneumocystis murina B123]